MESSALSLLRPIWRTAAWGTWRWQLWFRASRGNALILAIFGESTFASPTIEPAYLAGQQNVIGVNEAVLGTTLIVSALVGVLPYSVGTIVLGVAIWRSGILPQCSGVLYAASGALISILGPMIGEAQTIGPLLIVGGGWIWWSVMRSPSAQMPGGEAQPRVQ